MNRRPSVRKRHDARSSGDIFEILIREHADMLTAYLRSSLRDSYAVDDLFQETMIVAWRRLDDFDRTRPFGPWLRGIARNLVLAHYRKESRTPVWCDGAVLEALDQRFTTLSSHTGETFRERVEGLRECIDALSERLREVLHLFYGRGLTLREIGASIEIPEATVRKRAQRARVAVADCLLAQGPRS